MDKNKFCEEVHPFNNAKLAIAKLKQNCIENENLPDAILLDLNMPVMDGWQFLDEFVLLPIKKEISIFIITSSIDPIDIEMAKKYSVVKDYIMKPITAQKLNALCVIIGEIN
jgi:CheY-like chemotaxis protein